MAHQGLGFVLGCALFSGLQGGATAQNGSDTPAGSTNVVVMAIERQKAEEAAQAQLGPAQQASGPLTPMGAQPMYLSGGGLTMDQGFSTNDFWLQIFDFSPTNRGASLVAHSPTPNVIDLFFTTNLGPATSWYWIARGLPAQSNFTEINLATSTGFFIAANTNGLDANGLTAAYRGLVGGTNTLSHDMYGSGVPDWWRIVNFGDLSEPVTNDYDGSGISDLQDYLNGSDPNVIVFSLSFPRYVSCNSVAGSVAVLQGVPAGMAMLINASNTGAAFWQAYNTNPVAATGANDGDYDVWVGLRGRSSTSQQTWQGSLITRDTVPPLLVITNPVPGSVTARPIIQVQGYSTEPLAKLSFDLANGAGSLTNQPGFVLHQAINTNLLKFTTNWFQCYDLALALGSNLITLRATDLAGNLTITNLVVTLNTAS
ncbi:exported hypothetical protein [Verrucomicrobia bacterium]|nr:exported hypothetical protein [Verrucomicrobiota bacterium]